jgi:hypothetical protein
MGRIQNPRIDFVEVGKPGRFDVVDGEGTLVFFGMTVPIRWLLLGLLISLGALLLVAGAAVRYIRRQRKPQDEPEPVAKERRGEE